MKTLIKTRMKMNLQHFAEPGGTGDPGEGQNNPASPQGGTNTQRNDPPQIDYNKIQTMLDGALAAREDTALKAYFKQQGLSQEEAEKAIQAYKQQKAANTPDIEGMQAEMAKAQAQADKAALDNAAILQAVKMGIDGETIPYILKLADLSGVKGEDGTINEVELEEALKKVLEDLPGLKPQKKEGGGFQFGAAGSGTTPQEDQLAAIFGNKK